MIEYSSLLKNKNFTYIWISQMTSQITINILNYLLLFRLFERTGSAIATSLLWVAYALPGLLVGPFASASVDVIPKRKMLMWTNVLQALTVLFFSFIHQNSIFLLYGLALTYSFLNQFYVPAELATLPTVVKKKNLPHANSLFFITQQGALIVGFGMAGILQRYFGFNGVLYLASALLLVAYASVSLLPEMKIEIKLSEKFEDAVAEFFDSIVMGYRFIKDNDYILKPFLLMIGVNLTLFIVTVNLPVIVTQLLKFDLNSAGVMLVVPAGAGAGLAAVNMPKQLRRGRRKVDIIERSLFAIALSLFVLIFIVSEATSFYRIIFSIIDMAFLGYYFIGVLIPVQTFIQEKTPEKLRGRVFGNYWFLITAATVFPVILSGTLVEIFGSKILLFLIAAIYIASFLFVRSRGRSFIKDGFNNKKHGI
jgi:MFS family permease